MKFSICMKYPSNLNDTNKEHFPGVNGSTNAVYAATMTIYQFIKSAIILLNKTKIYINKLGRNKVSGKTVFFLI